MSLQSVINQASSIQIDRKKILGSTISRAGHLKTAERPTARPYMFTVTFNALLPYATNRNFIETLDRLDRSTEQEINIGVSNTNLAWITAYQGELSTAARAAANVVSISGSNIALDANNIRAQGAANTAIVAKAGDYISFGTDNTYRYPYTVTADVVLGTGANVTLPLHRPILAQSGFTITGSFTRWGSDVSWRVKMFRHPMYSIVPGRYISMDEDFQLMEVIT